MTHSQQAAGRLICKECWRRAFEFAVSACGWLRLSEDMGLRPPMKVATLVSSMEASRNLHVINGWPLVCWKVLTTRVSGSTGSPG